MAVMRTHQQYCYPNLLEVPTYNPTPLMDAIKRRFKLKNDAALARALSVHPAVISKLRHRVLGISAELMLRIHDVTGMPICEIRKLCGAPLSPIPVLVA